MDYQKVGALIAKMRKEKELTQKQLADKLGVTDRAVSKWERGLGCPDVSLLESLSRILEVSILEILKGRKLDESELISNEKIIDSMNYSKEHIKYKIKRYFNIVSIALFIMIIILLAFYNLKSIYSLNKTYSYNIDNESLNKEFDEVFIKLNLIKQNQGSYSLEDYQKILNYISDVEKRMSENNINYYILKNTYTYRELIDFCQIQESLLQFHELEQESRKIYEIIYKYDSTLMENIINYYRTNDYLKQNKNKACERIEYPYSNSRTLDNQVVINIRGYISYVIYQNKMILQDIVKAGDINE